MTNRKTGQATVATRDGGCQTESVRLTSLSPQAGNREAYKAGPGGSFQKGRPGQWWVAGGCGPWRRRLTTGRPGHVRLGDVTSPGPRQHRNHGAGSGGGERHLYVQLSRQPRPPPAHRACKLLQIKDLFTSCGCRGGILQGGDASQRKHGLPTMSTPPPDSYIFGGTIPSFRSGSRRRGRRRIHRDGSPGGGSGRNGCVRMRASSTTQPSTRCSWMIRSSVGGSHVRYHTPSG